MYKIIEKNNTLTLAYKGREVFSHNEETSFVEVGTGKLKYKSKHGAFSVKELKGHKIPLIDYKILDDGIEFFNGDIAISLLLKEESNMLYAHILSKGDFENISFNFSADATESIFGGGEQYRKLNLKGEKVTNFVSEHIVVPPIVEKTIFRKLKKYRVRNHNEIHTYSPMSTFVSSKKYAIRIDTDSYGVQDFTRKDISTFTYWAVPKSIHFAVEKSFKDISINLAKNINSNMYLPSWANKGMILGVQGGIENVKRKALDMQDAGAIISGVWSQDWSGRKVTAVGKQVYWNWEVSEEMYPNLRTEIAELKKKGIHFLAYINPYLIVGGTMYNECKEKGFLIKNKKNKVYHIKSTTFDAGMMDLTHPGMVDYLKNTIIKKNMLDLGVDGYMADFGEYLPVDSVLYSGESAALLHNVWPVLWARLNREAIAESGREKDVFFFTRSGYNGAQQYSPIMWNGDQHTDFSLDYGLPCILPATLNLGFSGLTVVHSDIGGFVSFHCLKRDAELFIRWTEINAFSPLMRGHETIKPDTNIQFDSAEVKAYSVRFSRIHAHIKPYIDLCMEESKKGLPVMRAPFYEFNDMSLYNEDYVYMLGSDILVAPIVIRGQTKRTVLLPEGVWVHLMTGVEYKAGKQIIPLPIGTPVVLYKKSSDFASLFKEVASGTV